jgi:hypothetical protein
MALNREAIWDALAERLEMVAGIKKVVRRDKDFASVEQPAILLLDEDEQPEEVDGLPPARKLNGSIVLYCRTSDIDPSPTTQLNLLLTAIEVVLEWSPSDVDRPGAPFPGRGHQEHFTNLGGLVTGFEIGPVKKYEGTRSGQAAALIPIAMTAV